MLHWSHTVSLRASSTLVRAAHSFFFAVVRDNLQCIYRWEKDPSGKSFCIWTEGANGAHSLGFFSWDTTNTFQQEVPICLLLKEALWTPQVSSRIYLLVLSAKAEELMWSRGAPWGALTMCFKSQHIVLYHWGLGFSPGARAQPKNYKTPLTQPWVMVPAVPSLSSCWEQQLLTDLCQPSLILCQISIALPPNLLVALA